VRFLKTNSGKKGEGMPVVRNPQFYFREGLCWSDINTTFLKCRIKQKSIHDVKSMSIFGVCDKVPEKYILCVINSTLISYYVDTFVNNTQTFQINDARQLPIIVPTSEQLSFCSALAKAAIAQKIKGNESSNIQKQLDDFIENQIFGLV
ncbi:DNA modification methylase, partial [Bacteroides sp.]